MRGKEVEESIPRFFRRLHWLYVRLGRFSYQLRYRMTALAWSSVTALIIITLLSGLGVFLSLVHIIGFIIALWIVAFMSLWFYKGEVTLVRKLGRIGAVGVSMPYRVTLSRGRRKISNFMFIEQPPDSVPNLSDFYYSREPGEELRNKFDQHFAFYRWQWLLERSRFLVPSSSEMLSLREEEEMTLDCELTPLRRGLLELSNGYCIIPEPLGIFQRYRRVKQSTDLLIILPKRFPLPELHLHGQSKNQLGGEATSRVSGQSGEFVSLRDYQPGDNRRMIHWKSWAKTGKPVIKEVEEEFFPRYGLVLDCSAPLDRDHLFEVAVSLAASFACAIDTKNSLLDVMFLQQDLEVHTLGGKTGRSEAMLEVLAGVQRQTEVNWNTLQNAVALQGDDLSSCIVVLHDWTEKRREVLKFWQASGLDLFVLLVDETKEIAQRRLKDNKACCRVIPIGCHTVEEDLLQFSH